MPRVKHIREEREENDVFIGRPSKWGNPFILGRHGDRKTVIEKFRVHLYESGLVADVGELKGKNLVCYCKPLACHGDVLLWLANK